MEEQLDVRQCALKERKVYTAPMLARLGDLGSLTGTRLGSGNDCLDSRVLGAEPIKEDVNCSG